MTSKRPIVIYDTTLRDGSQTEGINLSAQDKIEIMGRLKALGVDFIEGGWPGSNPRDDEFFSIVGEEPSLVAFGSTCKPGTDAASDETLAVLAQSGADWCCIVGKARASQVSAVLGTEPERNLEMIEDSIAVLKSAGKGVIFDAEHYFDGFAEDADYTRRVLQAAERGGADWIVLCDTNGGRLPSEISEGVGSAMSAVSVPLGIHCHNDSDLATANTLAAVEAGCTMVQGTINGLGERTGNANLCAVIPDIMLKLGMDTNIDLPKLTSVSRFVGEITNCVPPDRMPFVGASAFSHKGGMHAAAVAKDTSTYEHIDPAAVGNSRKVLVSDMSGRASVMEKIRSLGMTVGDDEAEIAGIVKEMESDGYQFDGADASFEMLVRKHRGEFVPRFDISEFRVLMSSSGVLEASIKVTDRNGQVEHTAADGNGPVNALDNALRKALCIFYPSLADVRLTDYKVRVLDEASATAARVRVLIRTTDGRCSWTTVGVSDNVVGASLDALVDSFEYYLMKTED